MDKNNTSVNIIYGLKVFLLAAIYYTAASLGLSISPVSGFATLVWPPTGIALAALLLYGPRLWPGIFLGAFLVNYITGAPLLTAMGMGTGNTLEALAGTYLLNHYGFQTSMLRVKDVLLLGGFAAILSTLISATIGVLSLYLGGIVTSTTFLDTWSAWWIGDALGAMIVTPFLLVWLTAPFPTAISAKRFMEMILLFITIIVIALLSFGNPYLFKGNFSFVYLLFPPLTWAALRFGRRHVLTIIIAVCAFAIWSTVSGYGPFATESITKGLLQLQIFIAVFAVTKMILSATAAERRKAEHAQKETLEYLEEKVKERTEQLNFNIEELRKEVNERVKTQHSLEQNKVLLNLLYEITIDANRTSNVNEAMQTAIDKICEYTKWPVGHVYILDKHDQLYSAKIWHIDDLEQYENFKRISEETIFTTGIGLPGSVLEQHKPLWITDVTKHSNFPRAKTAIEIKVKSAFAFPVMIENNVAAVLEFFSPAIKEPDNELLEIMLTIGTQLGRVFERQNALNTIKSNEQRLKDAQRITRLGSWEWDIPSNVVIWSDELYRIYGLNPDEFEASYEGFLKCVHPDDVENTKQVIGKAFTDCEPFNFYHRIILPDKSIRILKAQGKVETEKGKPIRMYGTGLDVTEQKHSENELRATYEKLKETQHELIHAEKLAALGRFSSGIAHEIRNPLANISALAQILKKSEFNERSKKHLEHILINTDIANKIIKDLLNYASPDDLELIQGNIGTILEKICSLVEPRCKTKKVKLVKNIKGDFPLIELNENKIESAFMNFISNAIDAMPGGGILKVSAYANKNSREIEISFKDTGIGIPEESLDKVFEPFYTTKHEGTGLGMSMAYEIIRLLGGRINIVSEVNSGTEIQIKIPYPQNYSISQNGV